MAATAAAPPRALPTPLPPLPAAGWTGRLRMHGRRLLLDAIDVVPGAKALVLDKSLSGPLGATSDVGALKEHGVARLFHLDAQPPVFEDTWNGVVYVLRPTRANAQLVSAHARALADHATVVVACVPRVTDSFARHVEESGAAALTRLIPLAIHFVPIDADVVALGQTGAMHDRLAHGDPSSTFDTAFALHALQAHTGRFQSIRGIGAAARRAPRRPAPPRAGAGRPAAARLRAAA